MTVPLSSGSGALVTAAQWIEAIILGPLAIGVAILAIAAIGLLMLGGRIDYRRGLGAILGCFIIFGAPAIADGLMRSAQSSGQFATAPGVAQPPMPPLPPPRPAEAYDPYAGASLIRN